MAARDTLDKAIRKAVKAGFTVDFRVEAMKDRCPRPFLRVDIYRMIDVTSGETGA